MNIVAAAFVTIFGVIAGGILAFKMLKFSSENTEEQSIPTNQRRTFCSLCLNDFTNFKNKKDLPCGDTLHQKCAELLFSEQKGKYCPVCRTELSQAFLKQFL